ncbi:ubiquinone/menaquinone biosynthesis C-methylase UbiE [Methylosinus sp. sav-2]|jgi:ubiquinone/menaquinone biosynthesis C-methylase UbiE|uniref:methyltransferase n=1 Tax=unclassified Methylosinus TaxID=2624500 RepID=UPI0007C8A6E1|nr:MULTISPECIES: class I SAM-dependent methyltransferase [unclassified Methylosinus]TDX59567.1 ubiquinone/menaquinone biosynthesis C-methylase UbiE [Methylosinus sp. sav-2]
MRNSEGLVFSSQQPAEAAPCQEAVAGHFERLAESYATNFDPHTHTGAAVQFQLRRQLTVELLSGEKPRALLDIAAGSGEITHAVASFLAFDELLVNDISPGMLQLAQRGFKQRPPAGSITWTNEDGFELLTKAGADRFDVILCLGLIAHTGRLPELLARAFTSLRRGGVLILQSTLTDHPGAWISTLYARSPLRRVIYKVEAFSKDEILAAGSAAGFELAEMRRYGICLPFGDRILHQINYLLEAAYAGKLSKRGGEALFKLRKPI